MARGKRKSIAPSSRVVPEDVGDPPAPDSVDTSDSTPTAMDAEEPESASADVEVEDSTVGRIGLPKTTISSCKDEDNTVEMAAVSVDKDESETVVEETVTESNITTGQITEERNGENASELTLNGGANVLKEVVSGEDTTNMVTDNVEDEAEDTNGGFEDEEGIEGIHEDANQNDDLPKDEQPAGQETEEIPEEPIKEKTEKRQVLVKLRKRKKGKKLVKGPLKKLLLEGKKKKVQSSADITANNGDITREDTKTINENTEENKAEEIEKETPTKKESKKRKRGKTGKTGAKAALENTSSKAGAEDGDKPESSQKKNPTKKAKGMGLIFMCNSKTKQDCYKFSILGLPSNKKELVENIYKGMRLFLYDVDLKLMYGIYKAAAPGGFNIEPRAFKSKFPSQVRFSVLEDCNPLPEEKFKTVIKTNYFTKKKFRCELTTDQVKDLCKLFRTGRGMSKRPPAPGSKFADRNITKTHRADRPARPNPDRRVYETNHSHPFSRIPHPSFRPPVSSSAHPYVYDRRVETHLYNDPYDDRDRDRDRYDDPDIRAVYTRYPLYIAEPRSYRRDYEYAGSSRMLPEYSGGLQLEYRASAGVRRYPY